MNMSSSPLYYRQKHSGWLHDSDASIDSLSQPVLGINISLITVSFLLIYIIVIREENCQSGESRVSLRASTNIIFTQLAIDSEAWELSSL
jgi:hypothetical protein